MLNRILLVSPREPSGASWLINCLLELGVRVNAKPTVDRGWRDNENTLGPDAMWETVSGGRWRLHPRADALKKWLPVLHLHDTFAFRDDIEVLYVQDLPRCHLQSASTALFVRDPRDAIHSLYRRVRPTLSLYEFVRFPHPKTLLDAIAHWGLFIESWLCRKGIRVYRFEDYKADAEGLLARIVQDLNIDVSAQDIALAARESTFEKAWAAEKRYRSQHSRDKEVANRAGLVGEWKGTAELRDLSAEIEKRIGSLLIRLGYQCDFEPDEPDLQASLSCLRFLSMFGNIELPPRVKEAADAADPMNCLRLQELLALASCINEELLERAGLQAREARTLLDSLQEYVSNWQRQQQQRLESIRKQVEDGGAYHMNRIRDLMAGRRKAGARTAAAHDDSGDKTLPRS